ncbi:MAG: hypothetical protein K8I82_01600 [Anaerolineae bacterium]|nr:hypothetical protein [Anaerolineae bacterium]
MKFVTVFCFVLLLITGLLTYARRMPSQAALLAFESQRSGNLDIYLMRSDGYLLQNLTNSPAYDGQPAWSPDGKQIIFTSRRESNLNIYMLDVYRTTPPRLLMESSHNNKNPVWSPDGNWILFESDRTGNQEIYKIHVEGTGLQNLTQHPADETNAQWSPDGTWIAFESNRFHKNDVYLMRPDGSDILNITESLGYDGAPAWSSDGQMIVFVSNRGITPQLYTMRPDGSEQTHLPIPLQNSEFPAWVGDWIAFDSSTNSSREVFRVRVDGTHLENLSRHPAYEGNPAWSPVIDTRWRSSLHWLVGVILLAIPLIRRSL